MEMGKKGTSCRSPMTSFDTGVFFDVGKTMNNGRQGMESTCLYPDGTVKRSFPKFC